MSQAVPLPDFGAGVARREAPSTPRELFCALFVDLERSVHFLQPAFELVQSLLPGVSAESTAAPDFLEQLERSGQVEVPPLSKLHGSSWPVRVVRELAPLGLSDGAWLRGFVQVNMVESEVGMRMLKQLMLRMGDPASAEGHAARFAGLLESLGIPPESITRWEWDESSPCADISYEHALLGLCLGCFPSTLALETIGFNLWMSVVGPCPLLDALAPQLSEAGANLRYVQRLERAALAALARQAAERALAESDTPGRRTRLARGFLAGRDSYQRWQAAMLGQNVPFTPRDFVMEGMRRKARFAIEHHRDIKLAKCSVADLLAQGESGHARLLDKLSTSALVKAGDPEHSKFMSRSLSIDGPMFDAFTAAEKVDLREWIERLPDQPTPRAEPVPLAGRYEAPQDPDELEQFAIARFGPFSNNDLYYSCANADLEPAVILFGKLFVARALEQLSEALDNDPRLGSMNPPPYSERAAAEMVAAQHEKNARSRHQAEPETEAKPGSGGPTNPIAAIFDGCWLQGFADVRRASLEEYGWLFRIYASEHGDGELEWNHDLIFRRALTELGPDVMLPKNDRRLYDLFAIGVGSAATLAVSLNSQRFLPEILGLNLGIEATGVGGEYLDNWKQARAEGPGSFYKALAARLHNSIDNYADGHTKWSLAAVQAFMRRVKEASPGRMDEQWHRIWRLWRCQDIFTHGTPLEKQALAEHFGVTSLAPTG